VTSRRERSRPSRGALLAAGAAAAVAVAALGGVAALAAATARARTALPAVAARVVTVALADVGPHRGVTVTARCPGSSRLVGGGGYLRRASDPAALPTNGLVLGGTVASSGGRRSTRRLRTARPTSGRG
jgi:hypothetical protein